MLIMSKKKNRKSFDFVADKEHNLFSSRSKEGVVIGPRIKGSNFHITAYSKGNKSSIHTTRDGQREKTILETNKTSEFFANLEKELAKILLLTNLITANHLKLRNDSWKKLRI